MNNGVKKTRPANNELVISTPYEIDKVAGGILLDLGLGMENQ
jgi:hypothetical protein